MTILINPCCTGIFDNPAPDVTQRVATARLVLVAAPEQRHILDLHHRTRSTSSVGEALQRITELIRTRRGRPVIAPYVG